MLLRVLLITPEFYGIEKRIKSVLEESGYEVIWFENKTLPLDYHSTSSKLKFFRRIYFFLFFPHVRYIRQELKKIENERFDILFSINGNIICPYLLRRLKGKNPGIFSVLYLWDSISMYSWTKIFKYFDKVYSFDQSDSEKYGLDYRPNFFMRSNSPNNREQEFDMFFSGKFNPFRLDVIDKIVSRAKGYNVTYYIKLWPACKIFFHNQLLYRLFKILKSDYSWVRNYTFNYEAIEGILKREYLIANSIGYKEIQIQLLNSNVILDLPYPGQTGYTHRVIEALANGKKVITTNSNIRREIFYNPNQIQIMDKHIYEVDYNWIKEKITFPVNSYFEELELSRWLKSMINVEMA
jgi:hypothetical protein